MVDLGKDTVNYVDEIKVVNRKDCCGGRLKRFYVEVLDDAKEVVFSAYHYGSVENGGVRTFAPDAGTTGRYVRVRHEDSLKEYLQIAELEVWGKHSHSVPILFDAYCCAHITCAFFRHQDIRLRCQPIRPRSPSLR